MPRTSERARLNALKRYRSADDPKVIQAAIALKAGRAEDYVRALIDAAPPLSDEQRARLASLLAPTTAGGAVA